MENHNIVSIEILKEIPFFGQGDTLESRLRHVSLRGFEDIQIYKKASLKARHLTPEMIETELHTPQPHLHQPHLDRVTQLAQFFSNLDIDIFRLEKAYDYIATSESGEKTTWTMLPPIVEKFQIPKHEKGGFDYSSLIGESLSQTLSESHWAINPDAERATYANDTDIFNVINDGSHRVHAGLLSGTGITILEASDLTPGYPYYAVPQSYKSIKVFENRDDSKDLKVHVVTAPGHKTLYRLFPSGGIMSGEIRPLREGEVEAA